MNFFRGTWFTGLLTRNSSHEVQSGDSILERSSATQGFSTRSDDSDDSDKSSSDTYYSLSSQNNSPIKCTSSNLSAQPSSAVFSEDLKTSRTPGFSKHADDIDGIWDNSRGLASDQVEFPDLNSKSPTIPVTNSSASDSNIRRSSTTATSSKSSRTISSSPKSSMEPDEHLKPTTSPETTSAKDHISDKSNNTDYDPENLRVAINLGSYPEVPFRNPQNSRVKAVSSKSSSITVTDSEKSGIKATTPKSCSVMTPSLEISNTKESPTLELKLPYNPTVPDSTKKCSSTSVTNAECSKITVTSPKSSSVVNTSLENSNTVGSMAFPPVPSHNETIKDDNEKNSNCDSETEISTVTSSKSSCTKASRLESFDSTDSRAESFDTADTSTESSWTTVTHPKKGKRKNTNQKNSGARAQNLRSFNTTDSNRKSPSSASYSKDSKTKVTSPKNSSTTLVNLKSSTTSRDAITNTPRHFEYTPSLNRSRPSIAPRFLKKLQSPLRSKTENLDHSSAEVEISDDSRVPGETLKQISQLDISVPSSGHGKASYSEVVKNSYSKLQSSNTFSDPHGENVASGDTETNFTTAGTTENNEIEPGADDSLFNPPTTIINPPYSSPLIEHNSSIAFAKDSTGTSSTVGNQNSSTSSLNSFLCSNISQSTTSPRTLATTSTGVKDFAISTNPEDEACKPLIHGKDVCDIIPPNSFAMSDHATHTPSSSPKINILPIGYERKKRLQSKANSHLLPEQLSDSVWRFEPENKNLTFSNLGKNYSLFDCHSAEKWCTDSTRTNPSTVQNMPDSLLVKNFSEVSAVSNRSSQSTFFTEIQNESTLLGHPKETELPDNSNERKNCIENLNQSSLTLETQSSNSAFLSSQLPSKEISEPAEEIVTSSQISREPNAHFNSQECRSITSELRSVSNRTSDPSNPNDVHLDPEGQYSTYVDPQGRRSAVVSQGVYSTYEGPQLRDCAHEVHQGYDCTQRGSQFQGPPDGSSQLQGLPNAGPHVSERKDSIDRTWSIPQGEQYSYPVFQGSAYVHLDSVDPHNVYFNSPGPNYPHPIPPNINFVLDSNTYPSLSSEG